MSDIVFSDNGKQEFNATILNMYNYTIYSNWTLSNASNCFLAFGIFQPVIIANGTVYNGTACEYPYYPVATRGELGIVSACLFCFLTVLVLYNLRKHGKKHLPVQKRFKLVSRRWPYYWLIITCAMGIISGFMAVDIDRDYIQGTALVINNLFYLCTLPSTLGAVWEMVRHWSSFNERRVVDDDPFAFRQDDRRSKIEFYTPLVFYLFAFLTFFLSILRTWTPIERNDHAVITDGRFKAASIFALIAWLIIVGFFFITRWHYKPEVIPWPMVASIVIVFIRVAYNMAAAWDYNISTLNYRADSAYIYGLGYLPIFLVISLMVYRGYTTPNEDLELIRLRRQRTRSFDAEMKTMRRPSEYKDSPTRASVAPLPRENSTTSTRSNLTTTSTNSSIQGPARRVVSMLDI